VCLDRQRLPYTSPTSWLRSCLGGLLIAVNAIVLYGNKRATTSIIAQKRAPQCSSPILRVTYVLGGVGGIIAGARLLIYGRGW
jgi:hypothetical protein